MSFQVVYEEFMRTQLQQSKGERRRRLQNGLGFAEKLYLESIWYPAIGNFKNLHAEYEITDYKDGSRFLDFAYLEKPHRICIEVDGFGPHYRDINRYGVIDRSFRQNDLIMDKWLVFRFPVDAIKEQPRRCQQYLQQMMGKLYSGIQSNITLSFAEKEVLRYSCQLQQMNETITVNSISRGLHKSTRQAWTLLKRLEEKKLLLPASGKVRVTSYIVNPEISQQYGFEYQR
jgi:very-short-patch-repair endonuclease